MRACGLNSESALQPSDAVGLQTATPDCEDYRKQHTAAVSCTAQAAILTSSLPSRGLSFGLTCGHQPLFTDTEAATAL